MLEMLHGGQWDYYIDHNKHFVNDLGMYSWMTWVPILFALMFIAKVLLRGQRYGFFLHLMLIISIPSEHKNKTTTEETKICCILYNDFLFQSIRHYALNLALWN